MAKAGVRKRVGVHAEEERAVDAVLPAVLADGLGDGQDVPFVEDRWNAEPRWPEVPNAIALCGDRGSGVSVKYAVISRGTSRSMAAGAHSPRVG